ncbi:MAG: radical SAM protein [Syntrophorhabdaceae bacterium]|nr:radical SAM protein [Syntrophorhabdaceae bacterium]
MLLLIYPPISIPSEPPLGLARLSGALTEHNIPHEIIDANIEGIHWLLKNTDKPVDTWSKRSMKHLGTNISAIKHGQAFENIWKYKKIVLEINRLLEMAGIEKEIKITLSDYVDRALSPVKSTDLITSAKTFKNNVFFDYFFRRFEAILKTDPITIAGFSINYLSQALCAFAMIGFLKYIRPDINVIIGGSLVNSWVKRGVTIDLFQGLVDKIIPGPGEKPLLSMFGIDSPIEKLYTPDYEKFKKELYLSYGFVLPYNTSTGCYWNRCTFCPERAEGNKYIQVEPEYALRELKEMVKIYNPSLIHLTDNAIHPRVLIKIAEKPLSVPWYGFVRWDTRMEQIEYLQALKQSGCVLLKMGIESADQRVLNKMKKGIDMERVKRALINIKTAGIGTYVYLLFGTPYETDESVEKTMDFILEYHDLIDFINIAIFNMPVNTPNAEGLILKPFYQGDLSLYTDFIHPEGWSRSRVRKFLDKEFKKKHLIKNIINRQPPFFTSNHAPFFMMEQLKVS